MNTTTAPRVKAGGLPPLQLHRGIVAPPSPTKRETTLQIDFVLPDEDEQALRSGFDAAMKAPISKPVVPQPKRDAEREATKDVRASSLAFWIWSAAMWTACSFGLGVIYARHFS